MNFTAEFEVFHSSFRFCFWPSFWFCFWPQLFYLTLLTVYFQLASSNYIEEPCNFQLDTVNKTIQRTNFRTLLLFISLSAWANTCPVYSFIHSIELKIAWFYYLIWWSELKIHSEQGQIGALYNIGQVSDTGVEGFAPENRSIVNVTENL